MYCQNCGTQNEDSMSFCMNCGAPLNGMQPPARPVYAPAWEDSNQNVLREQTKAPLFLSGAIAFSAALLFQLIGAAQGNNALMQLVDQYMSWALMYGGYEAEMYLDELGNILQFANGGLSVGVILAMIPDILLVIGIWLMFVTARKTQEPMSTTGLTIIKVITILQLIFYCIGMVAIAVLILLGMTAAATYSDEATPIFLLVLLLLGVIAILQILYYTKLIGTLSSMSFTAKRGGYNGKVSLYVAVISFLAAVAALIGSFSGGTFGVLSGLCRTATWVIFGIYLIIYRGKAAAALASEIRPRQPVAPAAPTPFAYQQATPAAEPQPQPQPQYQSAFVPQKAPKDDTTVLNGSSYYAQETTVLAAEPSITVRLIRLKDNMTVVVTPPQFRIGKDPSSSDYFIGDNTAISRQHADILIHDNAVFVMDLNSTNHVYVNGEQIPPGKEVQLTNGAELRLGDEKFRIEII